MQPATNAKPFAWSYSRLRDYETCPRRYFELTVQKRFKEAPSDDLAWGNRVHKAMQERIQKNRPLPKGMERWEGAAKPFLNAPTETFTELQLAITRDFEKDTWFGKQVYARSIVDAMRIHGDKALIVDWKTGKVKPDETQLEIMAIVVLCNFPEVQTVDAAFVWLASNPVEVTRDTYQRSDLEWMWPNMAPRVEALENATILTEFPAKPSGLCRNYCPVKTCPNHGT